LSLKSPANLTRILDRLTRKGFVERTPDESDRRAAVVTITSSGRGVVEEVMRLSPATDLIFMTAYGSTDDAVDCLKRGAADYLIKPFAMDDLITRIRRLLDSQEVKARCASLESCCRAERSPIIGSSPPIQAMLKLIAHVAPTDSSVLITGESGTGKELVAAAIHYGSPRAKRPYIRVNCAAIPEGLMESALFGHEKGAFTGAETRQVGYFERAEGGTLLIGVADDGTVTGFDEDRFESDDKALLHFNNLVDRHIGTEFSRYIDSRVIELGEKRVLCIHCVPAPVPAILDAAKGEEFYVRSGPASRCLTLKQFQDWLGKHQ